MQLFWDAIVEAFRLLGSLNSYVFQVIGLSLEVSGSAVLIDQCHEQRSPGEATQTQPEPQGDADHQSDEDRAARHLQGQADDLEHVAVQAAEEAEGFDYRVPEELHRSPPVS